MKDRSFDAAQAVSRLSVSVRTSFLKKNSNGIQETKETAFPVKTGVTRYRLPFGAEAPNARVRTFLPASNSKVRSKGDCLSAPLFLVRDGLMLSYPHSKTPFFPIEELKIVIQRTKNVNNLSREKSSSLPKVASIYSPLLRLLAHKDSPGDIPVSSFRMLAPNFDSSAFPM